ncbi:710_t:CDS:10, partial [Ambispora gerdemannii]
MRSKPQERHNHQYILVTYEPSPAGIKMLFETDIDSVLNKVKNLQPKNDNSIPGQALATIFEILDSHRLKMEKDTPYRGRSIPDSVVPACILWFTNGAEFHSSEGRHLTIPTLQTPGGQLFDKPYRWDHYIYTFLLKSEDTVNEPDITRLTTDTGGQVFDIYPTQPPNYVSHEKYRVTKAITTSIDRLFGLRIDNSPAIPALGPFRDPCVMINLAELNGDGQIEQEMRTTLFFDPEKLLSRKFFPIPEDAWIGEKTDYNDLLRIRRSNIPTIYYKKEDYKLLYRFDVWPFFEKYTVGSCPAVRQLISMPPGTNWPIYIKNSHKKGGLGMPFGFLVALDNRLSINLNILPYNYPALMRLMKDYEAIMKDHRQKSIALPTNIVKDWLRYVNDIPLYYPIINRGLDPSIIPMDSQQLLHNMTTEIRNNATTFFNNIFNNFQSLNAKKPTIASFGGKIKLYEDPFEIPHGQAQSVFLEMLRVYQKKSVQESKRKDKNDGDEKHSLPISVMTDYHEKAAQLKAQQLRNPFEDEEERIEREKWENLIAFGNPYRPRRGSTPDNFKPSINIDMPASPSSSWSLSPSSTFVESSGTPLGTQQSSFPGKRNPSKKGQGKRIILFPNKKASSIENAVATLSITSSITSPIKTKEIQTNIDNTPITTSMTPSITTSDIEMTDADKSTIITEDVTNDQINETSKQFHKQIYLKKENIEVMEIDNEVDSLPELISIKNEESLDNNENINSDNLQLSLHDEVVAASTAPQVDSTMNISIPIAAVNLNQNFVTTMTSSSQLPKFPESARSKSDPLIPIERDSSRGGVPVSLFNPMKNWMRQIQNINAQDNQKIQEILTNIKDALNKVAKEQENSKENLRRILIALATCARAHKILTLAKGLREFASTLQEDRPPQLIPVSSNWKKEGGGLMEEQETLKLAVQWVVKEIKKREGYNENTIKSKLTEIATENGYSFKEKDYLLKLARTLARGNRRSNLETWINLKIEWMKIQDR